jgi:tetratricopeptide (TPR) repeat protein
MSNKSRKIKRKPQRTTKPKRVMTPQQSMRLQQAVRAQSTGNLGFAEAEYRALIGEKIRTPELYCKLAAVCAQSARREEANSLWRQALAIDSRFLEARMKLAESYQLAGDIERSIKLYQGIISDNSQLFVAKYLLANLWKSQGKIEQAFDCYQQVMAQQPAYTQAHFSYSQIHKYKDRTDPHIDLMLELNQSKGINDGNRIHLAFALAKAFEDIGDHQQAFQYLKTGNDLRKKGLDYDFESDRELIQGIIACFNHEAMSRVQVIPETSNRPIFIIGMPRSGTSLVEKILSSHSDVYGAGELDYIFALGASLFLKRSARYQFDSLESYPATLFESFGKTYLEKTRLLDDKSARMTDKMPFNMMMIGLIKLVLPNARIIHCVRDARDTCWSIYKQNFTTGNYRFAYDLKTIGQFHIQYQALMQHWHDVMPGHIYDINYESLTHNPEDEIRKLLAACDLDWQENCLSFDKSESIVKTASAYQVRQPMYTSSVQLWEKYQPFIQPLLDELDGRP